MVTFGKLVSAYTQGGQVDKSVHLPLRLETSSLTDSPAYIEYIYILFNRVITTGQKKRRRWTNLSTFCPPFLHG